MTKKVFRNLEFSGIFNLLEQLKEHILVSCFLSADKFRGKSGWQRINQRVKVANKHKLVKTVDYNGIYDNPYFYSPRKVLFLFLSILFVLAGEIGLTYKNLGRN